MLILVVVATILLAALAALVVDGANRSRSRIPVLGRVPQFEFTAHDGLPFGREQMMGRLSVVDFIFTSCPGVCPIMASKMSGLYRLYAGSNKVQFVSISVDPERDSIAALQAYAHNQGVTDCRWLFLRAPLEQVVSLSENGFMLAADDLPGGHATAFVLVDHLARIRSYHDGLNDADSTALKGHIRQLARELP